MIRPAGLLIYAISPLWPLYGACILLGICMVGVCCLLIPCITRFSSYTYFVVFGLMYA